MYNKESNSACTFCHVSSSSPVTCYI